VSLSAEAAGIALSVPKEPLAQTLLNLMVNAIRHVPEGGTVRLVARREADVTMLLVRDDGPGIPPEERDRIFEPFRSTGDGAGLGLSIVRRTCAELGWKIAIGDAPEGGAEFRIEIPRVEPEEEKAGVRS
jgi:signal transduction histidine kinase